MEPRYTQIVRAVGESGTVQMKLSPLSKPCEFGAEQRDQIEGMYREAFGEDPQQTGAACLPYSETEDGDGDDD